VSLPFIAAGMIAGDVDKQVALFSNKLLPAAMNGRLT
jgi:hypothetical protein